MFARPVERNVEGNPSGKIAPRKRNTEEKGRIMKMEFSSDPCVVFERLLTRPLLSPLVEELERLVEDYEKSSNLRRLLPAAKYT